MTTSEVLYKAAGQVMTDSIRELELHWEKLNPLWTDEPWIHQVERMRSVEAAALEVAFWMDDERRREIARNFRLYEYTSEYGLREIEIPEVAG